MKYDLDTVRVNNIKLLDFEVEIVLNSIKFYCNSANCFFNRNKKYTAKDDELQISLITDTYEHISNQFANSKFENPINKKIVNLKK